MVRYSKAWYLRSIYRIDIRYSMSYNDKQCRKGQSRIIGQGRIVGQGRVRQGKVQGAGKGCNLFVESKQAYAENLVKICQEFMEISQVGQGRVVQGDKVGQGKVQRVGKGRKLFVGSQQVLPENFVKIRGEFMEISWVEKV